MNNVLEFDITKWDMVTCSGDSDTKPIVYVKPTIDLLDYFRVNDNKIWVRISGTDIDEYDGEIISATSEKAAPRPNFTPNYFDPTGMYIIALQTSKWVGLPKVNGKIKFLNGIFQTRTTEDKEDEIVNNAIKQFGSEKSFIADTSNCETMCNIVCSGDDCVEYCKTKCKNISNLKIWIFISFIVLLIYYLYKYK